MKKNANARPPKVSVVVPIYKAEKYLRECVDSILAQTLREIEVILVDDGSPDNCPKIVDEHVARDPRVVPVHQPNGGYGKAVNRGVSLAKGEYIGVVESDDWVEPAMCEKLYEAATRADADLTKAEFFTYNSKNPPETQNIRWAARRQDLRDAPDGVFCPIDDFPLIFAFHASLWRNLYRADFVKKNPADRIWLCRLPGFSVYYGSFGKGEADGRRQRTPASLPHGRRTWRLRVASRWKKSARFHGWMSAKRSIFTRCLQIVASTNACPQMRGGVFF